MIKIKEAIIVEGKYDKIKLSSLVDGLIIETHGFHIFQDKEQIQFIRKLAETRGILILTDSDSAGFMIRNYLSGCVDPDKIKHAYIPDIYGKESRKTHASKEGKLGVEGVPLKEILSALERAGVTWAQDEEDVSLRENVKKIEKIDLYEAGLVGQENSAEKRLLLLKKLGLPEHLTTNSLLRVLNGMMSYQEYLQIIKNLF